MKKSVIITGAGKGIGFAIAEKLASDYNLILLTKSESSYHILKERFPNSCVYEIDLARDAEIDWFCSSIKIDIYALVNNAGICKVGKIDSDVDCWDEVIKVNLEAPYRIVKLLNSRLTRPGRIINISSQLGVEGRNGYSAYCASKFGLNGLTKVWAKELGIHGITVNSICPGWVETEMTFKDVARIASEKNIQTSEYIKEVCSPLELKRFTKPEEVANLVEFLISDKASGITGRNWLMSTIWNNE